MKPHLQQLQLLASSSTIVLAQKIFTKQHLSSSCSSSVHPSHSDGVGDLIQHHIDRHNKTETRCRRLLNKFSLPQIVMHKGGRFPDVSVGKSAIPQTLPSQPSPSLEPFHTSTATTTISSGLRQQKRAEPSIITVTKTVTDPNPTLRSTSSPSSITSSPSPAQSTSSQISSATSNSHNTVIGVVVACVVVLMVVIFTCFCIRRRKSGRKTFLPAIELESSVDLPPLNLTKLELSELPSHEPTIPERVHARRQSRVQELASWKQTPFTALSVKSKQSSVRKKNLRGKSWYHHDPS